MYLQTDIFPETVDQDNQRYLCMLWNPTKRDGALQTLDLQSKHWTSNQKKMELKWNLGLIHDRCIIYLRVSFEGG